MPVGYSLFTITFKEIGGGNFDLKNITVLDAEGNAITSNGKIKIQKMDATGAYLTSYPYRSTRGGWCSGNTLLDDGAVTFGDGEAFCVNNSESAAIKFSVAGAVNFEPTTITIPAGGYTIVGNLTPVTVDLKDIVPVLTDGSALTSSNGKIKAQKMDTLGAYLTSYPYRTTRGGWCSGNTLLDDGAVTLAPGESICVNNSGEDDIVFKFPNPVKTN